MIPNAWIEHALRKLCCLNRKENSNENVFLFLIFFAVLFSNNRPPIYRHLLLFSSFCFPLSLFVFLILLFFRKSIIGLRISLWYVVEHQHKQTTRKRNYSHGWRTNYNFRKIVIIELEYVKM